MNYSKKVTEALRTKTRDSLEEADAVLSIYEGNFDSMCMGFRLATSARKKGKNTYFGSFSEDGDTFEVFIIASSEEEAVEKVNSWAP